MEDTDAVPIQTLFGQTIDTLAELVEQRPAKERAAISESTLRNVEKGRRPPTRTILMHLQSVPELRIDPTPLGGHLAGRQKSGQEFAPDCWLAPEFDALKLHREMTMLLNGQPLCSAACRNAAEILGARSHVSVYALQGDFHNLQRYTPLRHVPERSHRRRVICMFGNTFANLQNEIMLIRRYVPDIKSIELTPVLDLKACPVPGSYAADIRASVKMLTGESKQFSILYAKRYDREQLDGKMRREGWTPVAHWRYAEEHHPRLRLLYQRLRPAGDDD